MHKIIKFSCSVCCCPLQFNDYVFVAGVGPSVVRPVVISQKLSKTDTQLPWNTIRNLVPLDSDSLPPIHPPWAGRSPLLGWLFADTAGRMLDSQAGREAGASSCSGCSSVFSLYQLRSPVRSRDDRRTNRQTDGHRSCVKPSLKRLGLNNLTSSGSRTCLR